MPRYCVNMNEQDNGDHEVHEEGCAWYPEPKNQLDLGYHINCFSAVEKAKETYPQSNGCKHCSEACHTS